MVEIDVTEIKFGTYIHPKTGTLKILSKLQNGKWSLDEGKKMKHPIFRMTVPVVKEMSPGWPVFEVYGDLKGYELLEEHA